MRRLALALLLLAVAVPAAQAAPSPVLHIVFYLYYVREPDRVHHFFTADEAEFCAKAVELGYRGC
jgi:hypothetical protein